jgi:hypothetical protein
MVPVESTWDHAAVNQQRIALLQADPATVPHEQRVLVIDDTGDRKDGTAARRPGNVSIQTAPTHSRRGRVLAAGVASGARLAGPGGVAAALLASVVDEPTAPVVTAGA